ncbi:MULTISPECIES: glycosyltransferase family 2 protein [Cyanophyceae]|uniref:glycosyltransferase family 2 protein n=1 Tax=Cyanophyceae TaxID=3028117 RepID=UPI0002F8FDDE|nr:MULTISPECIES: glycosyltransferase family 2 protein [Cyanophyceae]SMH31408.1 Glycosyltransferase involved in cell wall bisynthesis [Picosynechococcus sp. OG1]SMQ84048.1 Glycosyltransferase involved in cell wall bisynthesis [Synechococcus sp. 7002]
MAVVPEPMPQSPSPGVSIIIPVYNEEGAIAETLEQLKTIFSQVEQVYEIIVVDDGSIDNTAKILEEQPGIRLLKHPINRGYGAALKTGIIHAQYDLIAITDADGTYPNERLLDLISLGMSGRFDMVVGSRTGKNVTYSNIRKIPKFFLVGFAEWIAKQKIPDLNSGMRVFRKEIAQEFIHILPDTFSFTTTITLAMLTNNYIVHYEPINYFHRVGKSKIKPVQDTLRFFKLILRTGIYFAPIRIFVPIASLFFLGFLISLAQDILRKDLTESTLILFVAATQLAVFSLLADMLDKRL